MRVYWHDEALAHETGAGMFDQGPTPLIEVPELHPENSERIRNIRSALKQRADRPAPGVAPRTARSARRARDGARPGVHPLGAGGVRRGAGPDHPVDACRAGVVGRGARLRRHRARGHRSRARRREPARLRARAPTRPPCPAGPGRRLLPVLERGAVRAARPPARARARRRRRLGRASRQRHPGLLLGPIRRRRDLAAHAARLVGAAPSPDRRAR